MTMKKVSLCARLLILPALIFVVSCNNTAKKAHSVIASYILNMETLNKSMADQYSKVNKTYVPNINDTEELKAAFTSVEQTCKNSKNDQVIPFLYSTALNGLLKRDSRIYDGVIETIRKQENNKITPGEVIPADMQKTIDELSIANDFSLRYFGESIKLTKQALKEIEAISKNDNSAKSSF